MTTQISIKVSGPSRAVVRRDNQSAFVVNSNEEQVIILDGDVGSAMLAIYTASTDMPYVTPGAMLDETKAFAPDPHEPDKTLEDRNRTFDPLEPAGRIDQPPDGRRADQARQIEGAGGTIPGEFGGMTAADAQKNWLDLTDEEIEIEQKKKEQAEADASKAAGEEEARKKEEQRVAKEEAASKTTSKKK